jgi:mRNA interferase RelE/StbE
MKRKRSLALWTIEWDVKATKDAKKCDRQTRQQIVDYLETRIATEHDPRRFGKALGNDKSGLWRYRVGNYRIICKIEDEQLIVLVVEVGHRRNIYG